MSIRDLVSDLKAISTSKKEFITRPYDKLSAADLAADASSIYISETGKDINPITPHKEIVQDTILLWADLNQCLSEAPYIPETGYKDGYIYGIVVDDNQSLSGCIKIGRSIDPATRESNCRTWMPVGNPKQAFQIWVSDYAIVENAVHGLLSGCRIHREWFRCSIVQAIESVLTILK